MEEMVVLVNDQDQELGLMGKQLAHQAGLLHRAFSVFVFNHNQELLLQQRAAGKYHSPMLWTNTCCSHPRHNETYLAAAHRRLQEEMGFDCPLQKKFHFIYKKEVGNGLIEHELDHVFVGEFNGNPTINPNEANDFKWIEWDELIKDMNQNPEHYTIWFQIILKEYLKQLQ